LTFIIQAAINIPPVIQKALLLASLGLGAIIIVSLFMDYWRKRNLVALIESVVIDPSGHGELVFIPEQRLLDPILYLENVHHCVQVIEIWQGSVGKILEPCPAYWWRRGIVYEGLLDKSHTLRILLRNDCPKPLTVRARILATKVKIEKLKS
jgi:hypothetical protein